MFFSKNISSQLLYCFLFFLLSCQNTPRTIDITGTTMGTTYSIKINSSKNHIDTDGYKSDIDSILLSINKKMSTWDSTSEISKFNRWESYEPFIVSKSFIEVVKSAKEISEKTNGYFDITVFDLMSLWGFGPNPMKEPPDSNMINNILKYTGHGNIIVNGTSLTKLKIATKLDLNAIAKGYAVDRLFKYVSGKDDRNIFVEIGGEIRCAGKNQKMNQWSIGIEDPPNKQSQDTKYALILIPGDKSVATSGNYRNFVKLEGQILGHTINPRSGFPVNSNILSVSVLANSCMVADAWATALMALDHDKGLSLVESNPQLSVIWIMENEFKNRIIFCSSKNLELRKAIYPILH